MDAQPILSFAVIDWVDAMGWVLLQKIETVRFLHSGIASLAISEATVC